MNGCLYDRVTTDYWVMEPCLPKPLLLAGKVLRMVVMHAGGKKYVYSKKVFSKYS